MKPHELAPPAGARRPSKRVGRGNGSGHGTYSGRGLKGQKSRSGFRMRPGLEGGQLSLIKRLPEKRGFTNIFRREYAAVNLAQLRRFPEGATVTPQELVAAGILKSVRKPVKVLGEGGLDRRLVVRAQAFSQAARAKIEAAGGQAEVMTVEG
ncbi:MAG: 50S ribosomal protein L15 [Chloroflexi bacterium]|nr:50S ribosomal protein L15 [Chloroflexota bacterium]